MTKDELEIYRRRLPHWRISDATYFVTWRLYPGQLDLRPEERDIVAKSLSHFGGKRYDLAAFVVMHNHVHVLVKPETDRALQQVVHSWKSYSAYIFHRKFSRRNKIWQDEYFDRIVRDEEEFLEKAQYILNNPFKTWPGIEEYKWVYVKWMAGTEARPTGTEARPTKKFR